MAPNYIKGDTKRCNGPVHKGAYISLSRFYVHKRGKRKGKPFSQCSICLSMYRFGDTVHGWVEFTKVQFIFDELIYRLGKMEATRRVGVSPNYFSRRKHEGRKKVRLKVIRKAMLVLLDCREKGETRHRSSIRRGTSMRGEKERIPKKRSDYYSQHWDDQNMTRIKAREDAFLTNYME